MQRISLRRYTNDFKAQAITPADLIDWAKAARPLKISVKTLGNRLDASLAGRPPPNRKPISELERALTRLKAENATLKNGTRDSKKATVFVAREQTHLPIRLLYCVV